MSFNIRPIKEKKPPKQNILRTLPWGKAIAIGMMVARPLYALGKRFQERREHAKRMKRIIAIGIAGGIGILIAGLAFTALIKVSTISLGDVVDTAGAPIAIDGNGYTNILLLGQGDNDHDGIDLTDTIIVASIDAEETGSVSMMSLPRDLYFLKTENMGKGKLNAMWRDYRIELQRSGMNKQEAELESMQELAREIGNSLGLEIHHSIKVDFVAFEKIIDTLDGIDVIVHDTIHDTEYPGPNFTYTTFHIDAGHQHLDGATALKYARSRHTTSDFDRSARQQQIIGAALDKARESGMLKKPGKLMDLYAILSENVLTDLSARQLITLGNIGKKLDRSNIATLQLNNVNGLYGEQLYKGGILYSPPRDLFDGVSVLLPVSIPEFPITWKQVQALSKLFFNYRGLYLARPRFAIFNGGAPEGSASRIYRELTKFGFDVVEVTNVPGRKKLESSFIAHRNPEMPRTITTTFADILRLPLQELSGVLADDLRDKNMGDIMIILGEDFRFEYLQNLVKM